MTVQLIGIGAAFVWVFCSAMLMFWIISKIVGLRVSTQHEQRGLDITEHGEVGYPEFGFESAYSAEKVKDLERL
jgi:ammonium transporter, Amt family